jgi:hypothetical protein
MAVATSQGFGSEAMANAMVAAHDRSSLDVQVSVKEAYRKICTAGAHLPIHMDQRSASRVNESSWEER